MLSANIFVKPNLKKLFSNKVGLYDIKMPREIQLFCVQLNLFSVISEYGLVVTSTVYHVHQKTMYISILVNSSVRTSD